MKVFWAISLHCLVAADNKSTMQRPITQRMEAK